MSASTLAEMCRAGLPTGELVIDAHCHLGPWSAFRVRRGGWAQAMVDAMDLCGISMSIVAPHVAIGPDERLGNEQAYAASAEFPDRIVAYVTINPHRPRAAVEAEIARWGDAGIRGFKIHPALHSYPAAGEGYRPMFEFADERGLPVLVHSWAGDSLAGPVILGDLAERHPGAQFLIGHAASSWDMIAASCDQAAGHPNVFLDVTTSSLVYDGLEAMVARAGADRILFGSDNPFLDPRPPLGRVLMSRISEDDKRLILGLNARRIFRL
jgi:predicted TIM-barrel fold metal-dependent hydrolase